MSNRTEVMAVQADGWISVGWASGVEVKKKSKRPYLSRGDNHDSPRGSIQTKKSAMVVPCI
jgi:hypothetical protein